MTEDLGQPEASGRVWGLGKEVEVEGSTVHLVKGPLLMGVFCELVNEGVQFLRDDDAVRRDGVAGIGVGLPCPSGAFLLPTRNHTTVCPCISLEGLHRPGIKVAFGIHCGFFLRLGGV